MMDRRFLVLVCVIAAGFAFASTSSARTERTVRLIATTTEQKFIDTDPVGGSQGDQFVFHHVLTRAGEEVGEDGGVCTTTTAGGLFQCTVTYSLPGGQITVQGLALPTASQQVKFLFAVTGGSGRYRGVRGDARIVQLPGDDDRSRVTLHLTQ
jgi:hypothetical protein